MRLRPQRPTVITAGPGTTDRLYELQRQASAAGFDATVDERQEGNVWATLRVYPKLVPTGGEIVWRPA